MHHQNRKLWHTSGRLPAPTRAGRPPAAGHVRNPALSQTQCCAKGARPKPRRAQDYIASHAGLAKSSACSTPAACAHGAAGAAASTVRGSPRRAKTNFPQTPQSTGSEPVVRSRARATPLPTQPGRTSPARIGAGGSNPARQRARCAAAARALCSRDGATRRAPRGNNPRCQQAGAVACASGSWVGALTKA